MIIEPEAEEDQAEDRGSEDDDGRLSVTPKEAEKMREIKATKFFDLDADIETAIKNTMELMNGQKKEYGGATYISFNEQKNDEFLRALRNINRYIAEAQTLLDSEITLDKSTPKFENYQNLFFQFFETCITRHSQSIFFQVHVRTGNYLYNYDKIKHGDAGLDKLFMLLSRVQGTLKKCGEYIKDEPPARVSTPQQNANPWGGSGRYGADYGRYNPAYPSLNDDYRNPAARERPKLVQRDIGDAQDTAEP